MYLPFLTRCSVFDRTWIAALSDMRGVQEFGSGHAARPRATMGGTLLSRVSGLNVLSRIPASHKLLELAATNQLLLHPPLVDCALRYKMRAIDPGGDNACFCLQELLLASARSAAKIARPPASTHTRSCWPSINPVNREMVDSISPKAEPANAFRCSSAVCRLPPLSSCSSNFCSFDSRRCGGYRAIVPRFTRLRDCRSLAF